MVRTSLVFDRITFPPYEYREYPKMLFHPEGLVRIVEPGIAVRDTHGSPVMDERGNPRMVGEKKEIVSMVVQNAHEETLAVREGWHVDVEMAKAVAKAKATGSAVEMPKPQPPTREVELARERDDALAKLAELQAQLAAQKAVAGKIALKV